MTDSLTIAVHGPSGAGKSWLGDTAPGPRLILDAEGGTRFTPSTKHAWDPRTPPPTYTETVVRYRTAVVRVADRESLQASFRWLASGKHPFVSLVIDPLTELVRKLGVTDDELAALVRACCDFTMHSRRPLTCVAFICQEGAADSIAYAVDVVAHLTADGSARSAAFVRAGGVAAKDRTNRLGEYMDSPTIPRMFERVYQKETA